MPRRRAAGWTCRRKSCRSRNAPRTRICYACGAPRPRKKPPAHAAVLAELTYDDFAVINGGYMCGICGYVPSYGKRKLDRDHDHITGEARGLLCFRCNRHLKKWVTAEWLAGALAYLTRRRS